MLCQSAPLSTETKNSDSYSTRPTAGLHRRVAPRVADGLTDQATSGLSSAIEAPARHQEPPCATFHFLVPSLATAAAEAQPLRHCCRASSAALAPARRCKNASASPSIAPPCLPLRPPPLSRAIRAVGEGHWPFFRRRLHGRVSLERSSPWSPTTETSSSSYLGLTAP